MRLASVFLAILLAAGAARAETVKERRVEAVWLPRKLWSCHWISEDQCYLQLCNIMPS